MKTTNHCASGAHYAALLLPFFLVALLIASVASVSSAAPMTVDLNEVAGDYHHINNTSGWLGHWAPILSDVNPLGTQTQSNLFTIQPDSSRGVDEVCSTGPVSGFKISPFKTSGDFDFWADIRIPLSATENDNAIGLAWNIQDPDPTDAEYFGFNDGGFYSNDNLHRFTWDGLFHHDYLGYGDVIEGTSGTPNYTSHTQYNNRVYGRRIIVERDGTNDFVYQDEPAPGDADISTDLGWAYDVGNTPHKYHMNVSRRGDEFTFTLEEINLTGPNSVLLEETYTEAGAPAEGRLGFFFVRQEQVKMSNIGYDPNPVPEPSSLLLALMGIIGITCTGRRRRRRA